MKVRHLRIRINTDIGPHGVDIDFPDGLVILRADNSMGKSTCIQAILVALGLEAMLTTSQRDLPLPHVMKEELFSEGQNVGVLESDIYLEIENRRKERIVIHRTVKGARNKDLVTVTFGPALTTETGYYESEDYFVTRQGSATREKGFYRFLAEFLEWDLPVVPTFDGRQVPLYLQCVFPFIAVEQKRGWASLLPPIPTQYRIRDPHRRSIEFLLNMDAYAIAAKRIELEGRIKEIENEWAITSRELRSLTSAIGGVISNLSDRPVTQWPPEIFPIIQVPRDKEWITLENLLSRNKEELNILSKEEIPYVNNVILATESELASTQELLNEKEVILAKLLNSLEMERGEVVSILTRLEKIEEDIQRNKDVKTLMSLGSSIAPNVAIQECPTCHQPIVDTLAPLAVDQNVMSVDQNVSFLEEQRRTYKAALKNAEAIVIARESQVVQLREEFVGERAKIRALRETLVSDGRLPSIEAIRKRVELEGDIARREALLDQFQTKLGKFEPLSKAWFNVQKELQELPKEDVSDEDKDKIQKWNKLFVKQLAEYDFQSLDAKSVIISTDTYTPIHDGFDLQTNISASDFIRIIWSYLNGLLEIAREYETNHPGLLIFDEPRQQSAKNISFAALLKRASKSARYNQQVIFATSENADSLKGSLKDIDHTFIEFEGRIIQRI